MTYSIHLWSQQTGVSTKIKDLPEGTTELEAEKALGDFWNTTLCATAQPGRFRARLRRTGTRRSIMTIG